MSIWNGVQSAAQQRVGADQANLGAFQPLYAFGVARLVEAVSRICLAAQSHRYAASGVLTGLGGGVGVGRMGFRELGGPTWSWAKRTALNRRKRARMGAKHPSWLLDVRVPLTSTLPPSTEPDGSEL